MSGGEPSSIKQIVRCVAIHPVSVKANTNGIGFDFYVSCFSLLQRFSFFDTPTHDDFYVLKSSKEVS